MKKIFKTLAVLAVVAALGFGFVSCGDSGDDNNGSGSPSSGGGNGGASSKFVPETNIKATFACPYSYQSASEAIAAAENVEYGATFSEARINFYEDGTFIVYLYNCWYMKRNGKVEKYEESISPRYKGSYTLTGEFTEGTLNLVCSYNFYENPNHPEPEYSKWLKDSGAVERTYAISGSKFECNDIVPNYNNRLDKYIYTKQ